MRLHVYFKIFFDFVFGVSTNVCICLSVCLLSYFYLSCASGLSKFVAGWDVVIWLFSALLQILIVLWMIKTIDLVQYVCVCNYFSHCLWQCQIFNLFILLRIVIIIHFIFAVHAPDISAVHTHVCVVRPRTLVISPTKISEYTHIRDEINTRSTVHRTHDLQCAHQVFY